MKPLNRHMLVVAAALVAVCGLMMTATASAATPKAQVAQAKAKAKKHRHKQKPPAAPVNLVPHINTFYGPLNSICDSGWPPVCGAPEEMSSFAECPPGYMVVSGGWEAFGTQNVTIVGNNVVSGGWIVVMRANVPALSDPPHVSQFRAIAQCQILLPA
jgi:hypothetical protein